MTSRTAISKTTGIHRPQVSAILNGARGCSLSYGIVLARVLGISIQRLDRDLGVARDRHKR